MKRQWSCNYFFWISKLSRDVQEELNRRFFNFVSFIATDNDTATSDNSYELSGEMDDVNNRGKVGGRRDIASTYFDQRIPIPREDRDDDVSH